jgi:hypothetical protein
MSVVGWCIGRRSGGCGGRSRSTSSEIARGGVKDTGHAAGGAEGMEVAVMERAEEERA